MTSPTFTLDQEQALYHLNRYESGNIFLTGGAGTGKSFVVRAFLDHAINVLKNDRKDLPVLASTGAAAILIGGRTFHSYFGLGIMQGGLEATLQRAVDNKRLKSRLKRAHTIVIDEISMLSWETIDCAEKIARVLRGKENQPWGGLRIVVVGDFAQLPPVSKGRQQKDWAFLGEAWANSQFRTFELKETVRTTDKNFLEVLNDIRLGAVSNETENFLDGRVREVSEDNQTHLFPRRDLTERFNKMKLAELGSDLRRYETIYSGAEQYVTSLKRDAPIPEVLELKKGALVMIRMNDPQQRYVNGSLGTIKAFHDAAVIIELQSGKEVEIEPFAFGVQDGEGNEVAFAKNFPINLAYASTIHKVQGATLSKVHLDLEGLWEPGHAYVALSRVRKGDDLTISRWSNSSIRADEMVMQFYADPLGVRMPRKAWTSAD